MQSSAIFGAVGGVLGAVVSVAVVLIVVVTAVVIVKKKRKPIHQDATQQGTSHVCMHIYRFKSLHEHDCQTW